MKYLKWSYLRTPSNMSPMFKFVFAYFLFLANIRRDLWTLIIGTPFDLSNWRMWYSRMTWCLLVLAKYLVFFYKKQNSVASFLNDQALFLPWPNICSWLNLLHMLLALCWVWSNFWTAVKRCFMTLRSEFTCTHHIKANSHTEKSHTTYFLHPPKISPTLTVRVAHIYPQNKNANISPWELCIHIHSLHLLS